MLYVTEKFAEGESILLMIMLVGWPLTVPMNVFPFPYTIPNLSCRHEGSGFFSKR